MSNLLLTVYEPTDDGYTNQLTKEIMEKFKPIYFNPNYPVKIKQHPKNAEKYLIQINATKFVHAIKK